MQIETRFQPGDIVFFHNVDTNQIMKGIVDRVRTCSGPDDPWTRIFYQIGVYDREEDCVAKSVEELREMLHKRVDQMFEEPCKIHDYALEQLAQF